MASMGQLGPKLRSIEGNGLVFWCPGCEETHLIRVGGGGWTWNKDPVKVTFAPSILVTSGHYIDGHQGDCWCTYSAAHPENPASFKCQRCHIFVQNGQIRFLDDCSHALRGQTVELPNLPPHLRDEPS